MTCAQHWRTSNQSSAPNQTENSRIKTQKLETIRMYWSDRELTSAVAWAADASFSLTRWQHSTFLREMTSWPPSWKCHVVSEIRLRQSTRIYSMNNPAKFHTDLKQRSVSVPYLKSKKSKNEDGIHTGSQYAVTFLVTGWVTNWCHVILSFLADDSAHNIRHTPFYRTYHTLHVCVP